MTEKSEDQVIWVCSCERNPTRIATIYETCSRCKQPIIAYIPHSKYLVLKSDLEKAVEVLEKGRLLAKEAGGFIRCHELALSGDGGNSNMAVMEIRIKEFEEALGKIVGKE